jgi:hypothetical protein
VEHCQNSGRFQRGAVIAMQDGFGLTGGDALGKSGSRAGLDRASLRQRSSLAAATPTCNETSPIEALSGGSNLATALSLNACPYRAMSTPLRPTHFEFYSGDNNTDAEGMA